MATTKKNTKTSTKPAAVPEEAAVQEDTAAKETVITEEASESTVLAAEEVAPAD